MLTIVSSFTQHGLGLPTQTAVLGLPATQPDPATRKPQTQQPPSRHTQPKTGFGVPMGL